MKAEEFITEWNNERFKEIQKGFTDHTMGRGWRPDHEKVNTVMQKKVIEPEAKVKTKPKPNQIAKNTKKEPKLSPEQQSAKTWAQNTAQCIRDGGTNCI